MNNPVKIQRRQKQTTALIGQQGKLLFWTIIRIPAKVFSAQAPYPVAIIRLASGQKVIGQLVDWQEKDLLPGREVIAVLRRAGSEDQENVIGYTVKFKPR